MEVMLWLGVLGAGWAAPPAATVEAPMPAWGFLLDAEFERLRAKAEAIRQGDFLEQEKARQLLKLIRPGLTCEQARKLLGERAALLLVRWGEKGWCWLDVTRDIVLSFDGDGNVLKAEVRPRFEHSPHFPLPLHDLAAPWGWRHRGFGFARYF